MRPVTCLAVIVASTSSLCAQDTVRLAESFAPGHQYRVRCRVTIEGSLKLPPEKGKPGETLKIAGKSVVEYHERVLSANQGKVDKTVRKVHQLDFARQVGDVDQESKLRSAVNLLVILRHQHLEVPFSPHGPLLWSEIDLIRTDVFTPALAGLLPTAPVKLGDTWTAEAGAVKELTDLETLEKGELTCRYDGPNTANRNLVRVSFQGKIRGVGEDGPAEHVLDGYFFFDLQTQHLSYVSLEGTLRPLDQAGLPQGEIRGSFVLTREPEARVGDLQDEALARLKLEPNDDNTLLLYETAEVKFLYPRHWRVAGAQGRQITLDERGGSGLLVTIDPRGKAPTTAQFQKEVHAWIGQQKARLGKIHPARGVQTSPFLIDGFSIDATLNNQPLLLDYYVIQQAGGGATLSGRFAPAQAPALQRDAQRIAQSLVLNVK